MRQDIRKWYWLAPLAMLAMAGCSETPPGNSSANEVLSLDWSRSAALTAATDCDQAEAWLEEAAITQMKLGVEANRRCVLTPDQCGWYRGGGVDMANGEEGAPTAGGDGSKDDQTPDEYSQTNTQVEGVDEADRVKTDGQFLYVLSDRDFVVVKSWPAAQSQELGRVKLHTWPTNFFLDGQRAIVLGTANLPEVVRDVPTRTREGGETPPPVPAADDSQMAGETPAGEQGDTDKEEPSPEPYYEYRPVTTVTLIDLADRTNPRIEREFVFDGYAMDSRRIGGKVYLALTNYWTIYDLEYWPADLQWYGASGEETRPSDEQINAAFDALIARNIEKIRARTLAEWLPQYWTSTATQDATYGAGRMVGTCTDVHAPSVFSGQGLLSLLSLDSASGEVAASTIQGSWGTVYASLDAVYVGSTNWDFYWWWQGQDEIPPLQTHVHKFAFDDSGNARYRASGSVLGYAINQFAFDEYQGFLRVATTDGFGWWNNQETESRVTVLKEDGNRLEPVGLVAGLGKGEQIYSVRFIGDQGYVVTFRQVDPLYVLDLQDPAAPKVAGELKIPGFSSYIHPLEPGFLLTAGRAGDEEGRVGGVKIEVFDVTDPANPKSVQSAVIGDGWNTWSDVLWDHKAFTFFKARDLLAIPVSGWIESQQGDEWWGEYRSELALFRVTRDAVEALPSISHMDFFEDFGGNDHCRYYDGYWRAQIYRGVFVEDYVYSLSQLGMQVHDTRDLAAGPVAEVRLLDPADFPVYDWGYCGEGVEPGDPEKPTDPAEPTDPQEPSPDNR